MSGKKSLKVKPIVMGNLIIDIAAVIYFIYIYFIEKSFVMVDGERYTNYEFWGFAEPKIVLHFAAPSIIVICFTLLFTLVMALYSKWRDI